MFQISEVQEAPAFNGRRSFLVYGISSSAGYFDPAGHVPHLHRLVITRGGQPLPIRAETHAGDPSVVFLEGQRLLPRGRVPHLRRLVRTRDSQPLTVRAETHAIDPASVSAEGQSPIRRSGLRIGVRFPVRVVSAFC